MISITIEIDGLEISMTADQAIRLRDELNRLLMSDSDISSDVMRDWLKET